ncbi:MAG TPA: hypothetical protein VFH39_02925 [Candidatus Saccharimonadales bacterium]|nr:hypothetical protein [Candidatus Saccharimonadales bacterium]
MNQLQLSAYNEARTIAREHGIADRLPMLYEVARTALGEHYPLPVGTVCLLSDFAGDDISPFLGPESYIRPPIIKAVRELSASHIERNPLSHAAAYFVASAGFRYLLSHERLGSVYDTPGMHQITDKLNSCAHRASLLKVGLPTPADVRHHLNRRAHGLRIIRSDDDQ